MKQRCSNPNHSNYERYGGLGITVCDKWANSFEAFLSDMGKAPSLQHTIDRIDTKGNYEPGNCRWATPTEQSRNTKRNVMLNFNGESLCASEWAQRTGLKLTSILSRKKLGWTDEKTLTTPIDLKSIEARL